MPLSENGGAVSKGVPGTVETGAAQPAPNSRVSSHHHFVSRIVRAYVMPARMPMIRSILVSQAYRSYSTNRLLAFIYRKRVPRAREIASLDRIRQEAIATSSSSGHRIRIQEAVELADARLSLSVCRNKQFDALQRFPTAFIRISQARTPTSRHGRLLAYPAPVPKRSQPVVGRDGLGGRFVISREPGVVRRHEQPEVVHAGDLRGRCCCQRHRSLCLISGPTPR